MKYCTPIAIVGLAASSWAFVPQTLSTHRAQTELSAKKNEPYHPKGHFFSKPLKQFQEELEAGKVRHQFPVLNAQQKLKKNLIRESDIPYEQRKNSSYDNKDVNVGYVPDGMTPHQWHQMQRKERAEDRKKQFARFGPKGFKSRSLLSFQTELEKGKAQHLMPVMFAKQRIQKGIIKKEDVPYMQRGGSWDNSDIKGASKVAWNTVDKQYESGEGPFSVWIFNKKQTQAQAPTKQKPAPKKKGFFEGLFP